MSKAGEVCTRTMNELADKKEGRHLRCASCGQPATPDDGLCAECAKQLEEMACSFEGREG